MARVVHSKVFSLTLSKSRPKRWNTDQMHTDPGRTSNMKLRLNCVQCSCCNTNTVTRQLWEFDIIGQLAK